MRQSLRLRALLAGAAYARIVAAVPTDPVDLFVSGVPPRVNNYRIPALIQTGTGALVAIAEARTEGKSDCDVKWLAFSRSGDNGTTWSTPAPIWGNTQLPSGWGAGNPVAVWDAVTRRVLIHGTVNNPAHCSPSLYTFQLDDGGSDGQAWGNFKNLSSFLGQWNGATPGPGTGTQLGAGSPAPGRLIVPAHFGAYNKDVSWYSDDHGASWTVSTPALDLLDEVVVVALPSGRVRLNARTDHANATCDCRATTLSLDGGATWETPVSWDATLIEPVCQASMVLIGPLASTGKSALFFSNPASKTSRSDITVRRSDDEGSSWLPNTWLVAPGLCWGGYSCMAPGWPMVRADGKAGAEYGGILFERNRTGTNVISFSLFPLDA
jgi:sialidase-1